MTVITTLTQLCKAFELVTVAIGAALAISGFVLGFIWEILLEWILLVSWLLLQLLSR